MRLICAVPNPGTRGAPRGLLYPDTPEGRQQANEFAREQNRPGWGRFDLISSLREDADLETFLAVLRANGIPVPR
jgi:hypothetical protein